MEFGYRLSIWSMSEENLQRYSLKKKVQVHSRTMRLDIGNGLALFARPLVSAARPYYNNNIKIKMNLKHLPDSMLRTKTRVPAE